MGIKFDLSQEKQKKFQMSLRNWQKILQRKVL